MISHQEAVTNREEGIAAAGNHAGESWKDRAATALGNYAVGIGKPFLIEDAADWAYGHGVSWPEDGRAWGAAVRLAQKQGLIRKCGYGEARTSNLSPKVLWQSALTPGKSDMDIEEIATVAVQVYDTGTTKPAMAGRLAVLTLISKRESVLLIETIDRYVDQHGMHE